MTTPREVGPTRAVIVAFAVAVLAAAASTTVPASAAGDYDHGSCIDNDDLQAHPFTDVVAGSFYADAVTWLYSNAITEGVSPTQYGPDQPVTRAQFATMLHRMACLPTPAGTATFSDLRAGGFYRAAVDWMVGEGITTGKTATLFGPDDYMTRGEFSAFMYRFVGEPDSSPVASVFGDVDRSRFFARPVDWLIHHSVTQGTSPTTFSPERTITRAEVATFLYRLNTIADIALTTEVVSTAFSRPTAVGTDPISGALYVTEQGGLLVRVAADADSVPDFGSISTVLDIGAVSLGPDDPGGGGEQGLLGVAVAPDGETIFVHYSDLAGDTVITEYDLNPDGSLAPATARVVFTLDQPAGNHNGGQIEFGPDGYLYVGLGDGGGAGDPSGNGQNTTTLLGTILRIDPFSGVLPAQYASPPDNPFVGGAGADEIWLYGLRNPWKFAFDEETGNLWVADVGQSAREEITRVGPGEARLNLGWNLREGTAPYAGAEPADHLPPVHDYPHPGTQRSITGGYVYRGSDIPALDGTYLYVDFYEARLQGWRDDAGIEAVDLDVPAPPLPSTFGQDLNGEIYVFGYGGEVVRLVRELS